VTGPDLTRGLRTAPAGGWRTATVREIVRPSPRAVILRMDVPDRIDHWPGQHYVIRLTAADGYYAQRSYSIASDPGDPMLEFYIERLDDGEVSGFLADEVVVGDELDLRGPIGGWFVWTASEPMLGVGGGSGVVPIVSMLRHAVRLGATELVRLVVSARTMADLPYADELAAAGALIALSRTDQPGRAAARITVGELAPLVPSAGPCLVCGSTSFSGAATRMLADLGVDVRRIRIESFGPTGTDDAS
jgi:ferredoxin-NADP reductase